MLHAETVALARESKPKSETTARVKFVAKARDDAGNMITLKENSRFVKENGRWYYIDGLLS